MEKITYKHLTAYEQMSLLVLSLMNTVSKEAIDNNNNSPHTEEVRILLEKMTLSAPTNPEKNEYYKNKLLNLLYSPT